MAMDMDTVMDRDMDKATAMDIGLKITSPATTLVPVR
jgi:hypothetical protein